EEHDIHSVWVHDYPLMMLPLFLKKAKPHLFVGFFLHSVFPSSEIYRIFPFRQELLRGCIAADIIGFFNFQFLRHFQTCCTRILGVQCNRSIVEASKETQGKETKLAAIPIGEDFELYDKCLNSENALGRIEELRQKFGGRRVVLGVDMMEERKGLPHKF
ncbi:unnamed protein product, partial [Amoebophrya sp. A25]